MVPVPPDSSHEASSYVEPLEGPGFSHADFPAIYERHSAEILRFAIRYAGRRDVAEDLASEAFLKMYQNRERIDPARAAAWLTTTVKNLAVDYWRRTSSERRNQLQIQQHQELPAGHTWQEILSHPSLNSEHRACLTLHYVHGMERKEISAHTGLTGNQVKSSLQYGLKLLRDAFGVTPSGAKP